MPPAKLTRVLVIKIKLPNAEAAKPLSMMMKTASPFYEGYGDGKMRILRNVDSPNDIIQILEYQAEPAVEGTRQKIASDPMVRNILQGWRTLFPGGFEVDVYEELSDNA